MIQSILVVEDDTIVKDSITQILTFEGFTLMNAENGADGLRLAEQARPDLIVCDLEMPELDGFALITRIRESTHTAQTPIIVVSGLVDESIQARAHQIGANLFLKKPFELDELIEAVHQVGWTA